MDNKRINIASEGRKAFDLAFQLAFEGCPGRKATHYLEHPTKGFLLFWHEDVFTDNEVNVANGNVTYVRTVAHKLPFAMDWKAASDLTWGWLSERKDDEYQDWCDHDGSDGHGFKIYNEAWGRIAGSAYAFMGVIPIWAWYGK